jgi:hypothetical protein
VHEEGKAEHQRRKIAFDQIRWWSRWHQLLVNDDGSRPG